MTSLRVVAHGGGVQTTAMLVLAATGKLEGYDTFLFANVGDDSEHPATIRYLHEIAIPYAAKHGITIHELRRTRRDGSTETLFGRLTDERPCPRCDTTGSTLLADTDLPDTPDNRLAELRRCPRCRGTGQAASRSLPIPVRMPDTGAPGTRSCTADFKIRVIGKWLRAHGATPESKATVAVGISVDEIQRLNARKSQPYEILHYPLVGILDGHPGPGVGSMMRRSECEQVIRDAGLPVPGKSSCWFCPFHRPGTWQDMRRKEPDLFNRACDLEDLLNERRDELGRDHVYLTRFGKPLAEAIPGGQLTLAGFDDDPHCDNGWCMT